MSLRVIRRRRSGIERPYETPSTRAPDLADQLWAFNERRRQILGNKPIDPEGERALGRFVTDPPEDAGQEGSYP